MKTLTRLYASTTVLAALAGLAQGQCNPTQLLHSPRSSDDRLGAAITLTRDGSNNPILLAGAPGRDQVGAADTGAVYAYNFNGSFSQAQQLLPSFNNTGMQFGAAVGASFPWLAVGAPGSGSGTLFLFQRTGNSWAQSLAYSTSGSSNGDEFGKAVAMTTTPTPRVIAGAPGFNQPGALDTGGIFILQNTGGSWTIQAALLGTNVLGGANDRLGESVAIDGTLLAAGAPGNLSNTGYAVVGRLIANTWNFTKFNAPSQPSGIRFGQSIGVDLASSIIAVGAPLFDTTALDAGGAKTDVGCVYLFSVMGGGVPQLIARLVPENTSNGMNFGSEVAISSDRVLVSAPGSRQVFEFRRDVGGNFTQRSVMTNSNTNASFGTSIALNSNLAAVGDELNDSSPTTNQGAVYEGFLFSGMGGDTFEAALEVPTGSNGYSCTNAMTPTGFSLGNCGNGGGQGNDAWFTFTPACSGQITIDTIGSTFDTVLTIHDAKPEVFATHTIGCSDDIVNGSNLQSRITIDVVGGQQYWARVAGYNAAAQGDATINISSVFAANDECVNARTVGEGTTLGSNCAATNSLYATFSCSGFTRTFHKDVWFSFVPSVGGTFDITTCGSDFDTLLAVYNTCPTQGTSPIACNDDQVPPICENLRSGVTISASQGQQMFLRLGGYIGAFGDYALNITRQGASCDPDVNQDGNADQGDVDYLINVIAGGINYTNIDPDFNQDGNADQGDIDALINVIAGATCP